MITGRNDTRKQQGENAVAECDADAQADQREHVGMTRECTLPAAHQKRPGRPEHHRSGKCRLKRATQQGRNPGRKASRVAEHDDGENGHAENCRCPEALEHVVILGMILRGSGIERFQRHAADRAITRPDIFHFRVHRAGVDDARRRLRVAGNRCRLHACMIVVRMFVTAAAAFRSLTASRPIMVLRISAVRSWFQILRRICFELCFAAATAEEIIRALVAEEIALGSRAVGIWCHPADGIFAHSNVHSGRITPQVPKISLFDPWRCRS